MWNYILPIVVAGLAGLQLAKDWEAHKASWRRVAVLGLIMASGIGAAINNYYVSKRNSEAQRKLEDALARANQNLENQSGHLKALREQNDLQYQRSQKEIQNVRDQLNQTVSRSKFLLQ
jgi:hypothetical protein